MERELDAIIFNSLIEVKNVCLALEKYLSEHPNDRESTTIRQLYTLVEEIGLE